MLDLLLSVPGMRDHWPLFLTAAYLLAGLWIGLSEALKSRRELLKRGETAPMAPAVILLALAWPFFIGAIVVDRVLICWFAADNRRRDREEGHV